MCKTSFLVYGTIISIYSRCSSNIKLISKSRKHLEHHMNQLGNHIRSAGKGIGNKIKSVRKSELELHVGWTRGRVTFALCDTGRVTFALLFLGVTTICVR